ncbi:MAG TPA: hypothetical protein VIT67_13545 [Povalibacter sp.]
MSSPIDDKALEEYLSRESQISQRYREIEGDDVPGHLDAAILAQASAAVAGKSGARAVDDLARVRARRRRLMQWGIPTTLAASTLLVVSIVIRSGSQHEVMPAEMAASQNSPAPTAVPPVDARQQKTEHSDAVSEGLVLIAPPRDAVTEFSSLAPARSAQSAAVRDQQERAEREQAQARSVAVHAEQTRRSLQEAPREMPPPAAVAAIRAQPVAALPPAPASAPAQKMAADAAEPERQQMPATEEASATEQDDGLDEIVVTGVEANRSRAGSGPRGTVRTGNSATSISDAQAETERREADPELWLEYIRQLRRDGKAVSANRQWEQFRRTYPDYTVDEADLARRRN